MLYLEFFSIIEFGKHLQSSDVHEALLCYRTETSKVTDLRLYQVTFSARTGDYISVCTFGLSKEKSSSDEEFAWLKQQVEILLERLRGYGVNSVKEGRWLSETPQTLVNGEFIGLLRTSE